MGWVTHKHSLLADRAHSGNWYSTAFDTNRQFMHIRPYIDQDLPALHQINKMGEPGVGAVCAGELSDIIGMGRCLVATDTSGLPIGFILLLEPGTAYASPNYKWFDTTYAGTKTRCVYVDRIAIHAHAQGVGLGTQLYSAAFASCTGRFDCIVCEVNTLPPNPGSLRFHKRLGFVEVGHQVFTPGIKAVVYLERPLRS